MSTEPTLEPCAKFEPWIPADLVVRDPWVCAGEPTMRGTRVLAETIVAELAIGTTWETLKSMYPSIPVPDAQPGRGDTNTTDSYTETGTGGLNRHRDAEAGGLIPADLIESNPGISIQPQTPPFEPAFIPNEAFPHLAGFINALKPAHYREAAASLRAIADHMPDTASAAELRPGIEYAATLLGHTADDLTEGATS